MNLIGETEKPTRTESVTILSERECWDLLGSVTLGRIVTSVDDEANIFPVNFAVHSRTILFRTAEGTKLISAAINNQVVFEADDHNAVEGWSVIVRGVAQTLRTDDEIRQAERAQLLPRRSESPVADSISAPNRPSEAWCAAPMVPAWGT